MKALAIDLGAGSGRALMGELAAGGRISVREVHRFANDPVRLGDRLHWDVLRLLHEIKQALLKVKLESDGELPASLGIDAWAVDFGLLGGPADALELLGNPYHYRDPHTEGRMEEVFRQVPRAELFSRTGIQFVPFNTIYQLAALQAAASPLLGIAERMLMMPALLRYFLTGVARNEFTQATTTQLYDAVRGDWDRELLAQLGMPERWFDPPLAPGAAAGELSPSVCSELGLSHAVPVIAVAEHDTASAVVAVPAEQAAFAYLICGTWSLLGTETAEPVRSPEAAALNFTNEGGYGGTNRLLKNIMGLWMLQELQRELARGGVSYTFPELVQLAAAAEPFRLLVDPDDARFLAAGDMTVRIALYAQETGQVVPQASLPQAAPPQAALHQAGGYGELAAGVYARCILESLALKYRYALTHTEQLTGHAYEGLHMVGGGIQNELLCQWTANALGRPVWAGPAEASALGNLAVQWIAAGVLPDLQAARAAIRASFPVQVYRPEAAAEAAWADAYRRLSALAGWSF